MKHSIINQRSIQQSLSLLHQKSHSNKMTTRWWNMPTQVRRRIWPKRKSIRQRYQSINKKWRCSSITSKNNQAKDINRSVQESSARDDKRSPNKIQVKLMQMETQSKVILPELITKMKSRLSTLYQKGLNHNKKKCLQSIIKWRSSTQHLKERFNQGRQSLRITKRKA